MEDVEGIILILSCQKHMNTRLREFKLSKLEYNGWRVVYVIGDFFMEPEYKMEDGNMLYIKCEDSYIHLLKKLALSIKVVTNLYNIKQGILRCGDDLIFNENRLCSFLDGEKYDFHGKSIPARDNIITDIDFLKQTRYDPFMKHYYDSHPEDFNNPHHNLHGIDIEKYLVRPCLYGPHGVVYYLSKASCSILVDHMEKIGFNIWHFDDFTKSYPYTIEDCAVTFIMYLNKINFKDNQDFFDTPDAIAVHTNRYK